MALIYQLLRVLVLGVTAAAIDDVPVTWSQSVRTAWMPCAVSDWHVQPRRPPPLLADERPARTKTYEWRRGDEEINPKRIFQNGTLEVVRKSGGSSEGVYQCAVWHHGSLVLGYPLNLKFSYMDKQFAAQPQDVTASLNQPVSIPCRISSGPAAAVFWTRDGQPLPTLDRYHILENELLILNVQNEDAGVYKCTATNPNVNRNRTSSEGRLVVQESRDEEPSLLPLHVAQNITMPRSSRVLLACPVLGWPRPKLIWELTPPGEKTSELESTDEVLELSKLEYDQEGVYTCAVEGHSDLVKTYNVTLTEQVRITLPPLSKEARRASTVRFNCTAVGKPEPNITWYKDGRRVASAGRINLRTSADRSRMELVISGLTSDDAGVYQCFASNGFSMSSKWARLNVTGAGAAAPTGVRCAPSGVASVTLNWLPAAKDVMAYTVYTTPADKQVEAKTGQPHPNTEEVIKLSEPLTAYVFQVRAFIPSATNKNIASDMSENVICQGQGVPTKLIKLKNGKLSVSWKQFASQNPGVAQWVLQYKPDSGHLNAAERNVTLSSHVTNYTLTVSPSQPLLVRVLGSRTSEWLHQNLTLVPWTSTNAAVPENDDGEVKVVPQNLEVTEVGETNFTVQWQCDDANNYTFYVCVRRVDGNDVCRESNKTIAKVENLLPDSDYEVRVQARVPDRGRGGAFTAPYQVTTRSEGPYPFKDLKYKYVNSSTLRISWNGPPARYTVHHSAELKLPVEMWDALEVMGNTVLITGLEPTEPTYAMVTGYKPMRHSPILNVPPQVRNLEGKDLSYGYTSTGVRVWWNATEPRVVWFTQNITEPVENWSSFNVAGTSVELNDLKPGPVFVMVTAAGGARRRFPTPLTIPERPPNHYYYYIGFGCGACALCAVASGAFCWWRRSKAKRTPQRSRRTHTATSAGNEEEGSEMRMARVANGGAGEPLLNGHVHITENPASKTPNGRLKKGRRLETPNFDAFDVSRHEPDTTIETVLDETTTYSLLDTTRKPEFDLSRSSKDLSANNSFNKLPDDNMNSELTRSTEFELDNSKIYPSLQPNG